MSFKENLIEKIKIDTLTAKILKTLGPPGSGAKADLNSIKILLEKNDFSHEKVRDLDLYIKDKEIDKPSIIVLDNELALYKTDIMDVTMRKSPTVKEMVSIRNAIKILNDKDVVITKRQDTIEYLRKEYLGGLDLNYNETDIDEMAKEGEKFIENNYFEGISECLMLFEELLTMKPAPQPFRITHYEIMGNVDKKNDGEFLFGPIVIHNKMDGKLMLINKKISSKDKAGIDNMKKTAKREENADFEDGEVFEKLKQIVLIEKPSL